MADIQLRDTGISIDGPTVISKNVSCTGNLDVNTISCRGVLSVDTQTFGADGGALPITFDVGNAIAALQLVVAALGIKQDQFKSEVGLTLVAASQGITALQNKDKSTDTTIAALKTQIKELQTQVASHAAQLTALRSEVNDLKTKIAG